MPTEEAVAITGFSLGCVSSDSELFSSNEPFLMLRQAGLPRQRGEGMQQEVNNLNEEHGASALLLPVPSPPPSLHSAMANSMGITFL